jgi:hypothetical protein
VTTIVEWAASQVGVREDPPRSNDGEPMRRYALPGERPAAWCARFVRAGFSAIGHPLPGNQWLIPSVVELQRALGDLGAFIPIEAARAFIADGVGAPAARPRPGDLVFLGPDGLSDIGRRGHHVGVVERFEDGVICSIDGNWSDAVTRVKRPLSAPELWGLARWPLVSPT